MSSDADSDVEIVLTIRTPRLEFTPSPPPAPASPKPDPQYWKQEGRKDTRYDTQFGRTSAQLVIELKNGNVEVFNPRQDYFGRVDRPAHAQRLAKPTIPFRIKQPGRPQHTAKETNPKVYQHPDPEPKKKNEPCAATHLKARPTHLSPADQFRAFEIEEAFKNGLRLSDDNDKAKSKKPPSAKRKSPTKKINQRELNFRRFKRRHPAVPRTKVPKEVRNKDPFAISNTALYPPILLDYEDLAHAYAKNKARKGPRIATKPPAKPILKPSTLKANHQVPKRKSPTPDNWRKPHAPNSNWRAQPPAQPAPEVICLEDNSGRRNIHPTRPVTKEEEEDLKRQALITRRLQRQTEGFREQRARAEQTRTERQANGNSTSVTNHSSLRVDPALAKLFRNDPEKRNQSNQAPKKTAAAPPPTKTTPRPARQLPQPRAASPRPPPRPRVLAARTANPWATIPDISLEDYIREKGIRAAPVGKEQHQGHTHFHHWPTPRPQDRQPAGMPQERMHKQAPKDRNSRSRGRRPTPIQAPPAEPEVNGTLRERQRAIAEALNEPLREIDRHIASQRAERLARQQQEDCIAACKTQ